MRSPRWCTNSTSTATVVRRLRACTASAYLDVKKCHSGWDKNSLVIAAGSPAWGSRITMIAVGASTLFRLRRGGDGI